jgi:predicted ArsR family transcriptional regulator
MTHSHWRYRWAVQAEHVVKAIASLDDDVRRALYQFVRRQTEPVTRQAAARAVRISPKLAAFHLDKLVERGLLDADHDHPEGVRRRVGRAPKRYSASAQELSLSIPERHYDLIGAILVDTLVAADGSERPTEIAERIAAEGGQAIGEATRRQRRHRGRLGIEGAVALAEDLLREHGYEPLRGVNDELRLRNCPFRALALRAPDLICAINLGFVSGLVHGIGNDNVDAYLTPTAGACCVTVGIRPPG